MRKHHAGKTASFLSTFSRRIQADSVRSSAVAWILRCMLPLMMGSIQADQILITEIMRAPQKPSQPTWIELSNLTATPLDCAQWLLRGKAFQFEFPSYNPEKPEQSFIKPFERLIICDQDSASFRKHHAVEPGIRILGPWQGTIGTQREKLRLLDKNGLELTRVDWHDLPPWPTFINKTGHTMELINPDSDPDDWRNWTRSQTQGGTPGKLGVPVSGVQVGPSKGEKSSLGASSHHAGLHLSQIVVTPQHDRPPSIALTNAGAVAIDLSAWQITEHRQMQPAVMLDGHIAAGQTRWFPLLIGKDTLSSGWYLHGKTNGVLIDEAFPPQRSFQFDLMRVGVAKDQWRTLSTESTGSSPTPLDCPKVMINEMMFDPPHGNEALEFIELHNASKQPVDLTDWRLSEAVDFTFPKNTQILPWAFVVIAQDPKAFSLAYPGRGPIGAYQGKLANRGERITLQDASGNIVDAVDFGAEGRWPDGSAGLGSSMELIHPSLDNDLPSAWAASRQSRSAKFRTHTLNFVYQDRIPIWGIHDRKELHAYLTGQGHVAIRHLRLTAEAHPEKNLLKNQQRKSIEGDGATGWLMQGNHSDSFIANEQLHLVSTGHGDNKANRIEIDVLNLEEGERYQLQFEARWIQGTPRFILRTWDDSLSASIGLEIPSSLGSPGRPNTQFKTAPPPQLDAPYHHPVVPSPGEPITFQVQARWPKEVGQLELVYRLDALDQEPWRRRSMQAAETKAPLETAKPLIYSTTLKEPFKQGDLLEYYFEATTSSGERATLPAKPQTHASLCIIDQRGIPNDLRVCRFLIRARDLEAIERGESQAYQYRYPRLSNQYFNATFISNEQQVFHGAKLRASGSAWTRQSNMERGKWKLPTDSPFRNHSKFTYDDDPTRQGGMFRHHNRLVRYLLYLLGHPSGQNEFIHVIINDGPFMLREDVEPVDSDFLKRHFEDGNQGELYRVDDEWWMSDHWSQRHRDASWDLQETVQKGFYRHAWMKRSREEEDNYSALLDFFTLVNQSPEAVQAIGSKLDTRASLQLTAVLGFVADWDTFTQSRGKNAYFYRRAHDGRFQWLQWDSDLAFGNRSRGSFYGGSDAFVRWMEQPEQQAAFRDMLDQLVSLTSGSKSRVEAWMAQEASANAKTAINIPFYRSFFKQRREDVANSR